MLNVFKRLPLAACLIVVMWGSCWATDAQRPAAALSDSETKALLWRISLPGQHASFLFGTMHSEDARILALLDHVQPKIEQLQCLALELDLNPMIGAKVMQAMFFADGQALQPLLKKETHHALVELLQREYALGEAQVNLMKPWAVMMLLSAPKPVTGNFLDKALYLFALENNMKMVGLETPEEQIAVMDQMTLSDQVALMEMSLKTYPQMPFMFERLVGAYLEQDFSMMEKLYDEYTVEGDDALIKMLTERLLNERNDLMLTRMTALIKDQSCFIAVGALHLPGETGLLNRLRSLGYTTEAVALKF